MERKRLSLVSRNILANFAGSAWTGVMSFAFVPLYMRYIGAEGYGLVGFFASITAVLSLLDGGLAAAVGRELAQITEAEEDANRARTLVRSLEVLFWVFGILAGLAIIAIAPLLVRWWLRVDNLGDEVAVQAIRLLGAAFIVQWPVTLYNACLVARQKQVLLNLFSIGNSTFKAIGAVVVLTMFSSTVHAFFAWQVVSSAMTVLVARSIGWRSLPTGSARDRFSLARLRDVLGFAAGVSGINVLSVLLTQVDKLILSKLVSLAEFGYYVLAWNLALLLYRLSGPIFNALLPRITQLYAKGATHDFTSAYWRGCALIAIALVPTALLPVYFAKPLLLLWSRDASLVAGVERALQVLVVGTMLNGLTLMPYGLQLACGWTSLALRANLVSAVALVPLVWILAKLFGSVGAAAAWPLLNAAYILLVVPAVHRRLALGSFGRWLVGVVGAPVLAVVGIYWLGQTIIGDLVARPALGVVSIAFLYLTAVGGVFVVQRARLSEHRRV